MVFRRRKDEPWLVLEVMPDLDVGWEGREGLAGPEERGLYGWNWELAEAVT